MAFFPDISRPVAFEGRDSKNPFAFRHYDAAKVVGDRTMAEHLRFAVSWWHTFRPTGTDPFGPATSARPWETGDPMESARQAVDAAFEFFEKLGVGFYCFHDRDVAPEGASVDESRRNLDTIVELLERRQRESGVKLLWGTANLFSHPRYQSGASTNPDPAVFAHAGTQVKAAMEATARLGGAGYVFWGGREGYDTLLNTDMRREREGFAALLHMAVAHKKALGWDGQLYIEPKPKEPMKHQYDSDAAACLNFLREFGLLEHLKLNLETNHATLAGHSMAHEMRVAREAGALGSVDANMGDELLGWDTDEFPTNVYVTTEIMLEVLAMGGFTSGGLNFDAKVRRASHENSDLFHAHIGGMDAFARGLEIAHAIRADGRLDAFVADRYAGWDGEFGRRVRAGEATLADCEAEARRVGEPVRRSGRQEMLRNLVNEFVR